MKSIRILVMSLAALAASPIAAHEPPCGKDQLPTCYQHADGSTTCQCVDRVK